MWVCLSVADMMCICFLQCVQAFCNRLETTTRQKITKVGSMFPVAFTVDRIELHFPNDRDIPTGWSLTCASNPVVSAH